MSKTFLYLGDKLEIYTYFTLSLKHVSIMNEELSKSAVKKLNGLDKNCKEFIAVLLGQIGRNYKIDKEDNPVNMDIMMTDIINFYLKTQKYVGCRVLILECCDNLKLKNLYNKFNFHFLQKNDDPEKDLIQMYQIID